MANLNVLDGAGSSVYIAASGAGSNGDPFIFTRACTQSGTWNITNISGTVSLPTGASTAAKQPALGSAGSASTDVITVQGITSMVPLLVTLSGTNTVTTITNVVHVDDNSGSLTVDNNGTFAVQAALTAGETHVGEVGGNCITIVKEFTRPADTTAYTAGDVISDSTTTTTMQAIGNFARVNAGSGYITRARLTTNKKSITPRIRVHVYNATGATLAGDNLAWKDVYGDESITVGYFDFGSMITGTDTTNSTTSYAENNFINLNFVCASSNRNLYFVLEALDAFTPDSGQKFSLRLWGDLN